MKQKEVLLKLWLPCNWNQKNKQTNKQNNNNNNNKNNKNPRYYFGIQYLGVNCYS